MLFRFATLFSTAIYITCAAYAGTYWVSVDGEASWSNCASSSPVIGTACCSLETANANSKAGDVVYLRGGTYSGLTIQPENSGESETRRISFLAYNNERVVFEESRGIFLIRKSFISVSGLRFQSMECFFRIYGGHHNVISLCEFDGRCQSSGQWAGGMIVRSPPSSSLPVEYSTHNRIQRCKFFRFVYKGRLPNRGALLDIGSPSAKDPADTDESTHNLIENCVFAYGGHHTLGVFTRYNVIRNNYSHNETNPKNWDFPGYRGAITQGLAGGRSLWEGNRFGYSDTKGLDVRTSNNIIRRNQFFHHGHGGLQVATNLVGIDRADENRIYQNTFFHNGHDVGNVGFQGGMFFANWQKNGSKGQPKGNVVMNNLFFGNKNGSVMMSEGPVIPQIIENNWEQNDINPGFVDLSNTDPDVATLPNLRLTNKSPAKDRGKWLTTITSGDPQSNTFTVTDANYFTDGWGIIAGDEIQLEGQKVTTKITSVDYQTNTITIDQPLDLKKGQGVAMAYVGAAPDLGAFEIIGD